jgi:cellulose synthase operon protein C
VLAMLNGDHRQAQVFRERAAASPAVIADRAALALAEGDAERALELADAALSSQPGHSAATWNRALALRELGLPRASAAAFRQVASGGEAGWADEANARAAALEREAEERGGLTERVLAAGPQLAAHPEALAVQDAQALPGMSRLFVYDALRAATSAQLPRLAKLVAAVEGGAGGEGGADAAGADGALDPLAGSTAAEDADGLGVEGAVAGFARRAAAVTAAHPELAATYAEILAGRPPTGPARPKYLAALRAARADELLIGALIRLSPSGRVVAAEELPELARLAAASPDP